MAHYQDVSVNNCDIKQEVEEQMLTGARLCLSQEAKQQIFKEELYVDHLIKEEVVIGPEEVQEVRLAKSSVVTSAATDIGAAFIRMPQSVTLQEGNERRHEIEKGIMDHKTVVESGTVTIARELKSDCDNAHKVSITATVSKDNVQEKQKDLNTAPVFKCYDKNKSSNFSESPTYLSGLSQEKEYVGSHFQHKYSCDTTLQQHLALSCSWKSMLVQHLRTQTCEKPYSCSYCEYTCSTNSHLKSHLRTHTGEKPYSCTYCEYSCSTGGSLKIHLSTHTGEKPYSCSYCEYSCTTSSVLKRHVRTHTGEKPYSCSYCDHSCSTNSDLKRHLRTHTGEKPYSCTYCEYNCGRKETLIEHIRTHTGENPYNCPYCKYSCITSSHLKRHFRTHTGEKPNRCSYCVYSCSTNSDLKRHLRTHTGEKPYSCSYCEYNCNQKGNLIKHLKKTHWREAT